jgi:hypothetical protein
MLPNYNIVSFVHMAVTGTPAPRVPWSARLGPCNHLCQYSDRGTPFENLWKSDASRGRIAVTIDSRNSSLAETTTMLHFKNLLEQQKFDYHVPIRRVIPEANRTPSDARV